MRALLPFVAILAFALPGCLEPVAPGPDPGDLTGLLRASEEPLWFNPQTAPHPAFNFPTLTNVAVGADVPAWWNPIPAAKIPAKITGLDAFAKSGPEVEGGAGMSVFGSLAVVPGYSTSTYILNISDPSKPTLLSTIEEQHRNVDFIAYPSGRLVAVFSTDSGVLPVWDLTDPTEPVRLTELKPKTGTHKVNIVPGTPIVYNANSAGGGATIAEAAVPQLQEVTGANGQTEIYDLSNPEQPVHVQDWKNGYGCHHIYFWINEEAQKFRALCAGIEATQIWDIADPLNPKVIVTIPVHHGDPRLPSGSVFLMAFSHFSILNYAGDVLIVGDEMGGGAVPPGCLARTPTGELTTPAGALWFYDVSDEKNPRMLGWFSPGAPTASDPPEPEANPGAVFYSCTAHHGRLVPDPEGKRDLLAMAFYRAGVVLVDFTDPARVRMVDQFVDGSDTWEAQYYNGYIFTGDLARGMDVLKLV